MKVMDVKKGDRVLFQIGNGVLSSWHKGVVKRVSKQSVVLVSRLCDAVVDKDKVRLA